MLFSINGVSYQLPVSLLEITLSDRIAYDEEHGKELRNRLSEILKMKEGIDRDLEMGSYYIDVACRTLSYFGKIPFDIVSETDVKEVIVMYNQTMKPFSEDFLFTEDFELKHEFVWNDERWEIPETVLRNSSTMTAGEYVDAKEMVKTLSDLSDNRWEALHRLCCIYFRKKGEPFSPALYDEESERYRLLREMPLEYALHVGFFLSSSMNTYMKILNYSETSAAQA